MSFKTTALSAAISAALGMAAAGTASADALLAPWVKASAADGFQTYLMMKVEGYGYEDDRFDDTSDLHYFFYEWDGETDGLPCPKFDRRGVVSSWDMVFQSVSTNPAGYTGPAGDQSEPVQVFDDFEGFLIVDDEDASSSSEGNFSGFVYVVDLANGLIADYKMLNNPNSMDSGDFSDPSVSKTIADMAWWPQDVITTEWLVLATGKAMTEGEAGTPSNAIHWDGAVDIRHCNAPYEDPEAPPGCGYPDPFGGQQGAYDNDEALVSGFSPEKVVCMGWIDPTDLLGSNQLGFTVNGGWTRVNFVPVPWKTNEDITSTGAVVYRQDTSNALGFPIYTFVQEAAGTTTSTPGGVNAPY
jgi:hypothetical protein